MSSSGDSVCIFVSSSDRTRDVFERVFAHFGKVWPDCPYERFVGFTTNALTPAVNGFTVVSADAELQWRQELIAQLSKLPVHFEHVLLLLDDFLFLEKVESERLQACVHESLARDMAYLRLKPLERSWMAKFIRNLMAPATLTERLHRNEPYYSSLQAAVWRKDHLLWCLSQSGSIWEFEHLVPPQEHWAVRQTALPYRHVVEKGRWMADAPALFHQVNQQFEAGTRLSCPPITGVQWCLGRIKFGLFGYYGMKAKRSLRGYNVKSR